MLIKSYYENGETLNEETYQTIRQKEDEMVKVEEEIVEVKADLKSKTQGMDDETFRLHLEYEKLKGEISDAQRQLDEYESKNSGYCREFDE